MYLTIEELMELTGYSKNTIYALCNSLDITPIRGQIKGNAGKGLYTLEDLDRLLQYKKLVNSGKSKNEAITEVLAQRA